MESDAKKMFLQKTIELIEEDYGNCSGDEPTCVACEATMVIRFLIRYVSDINWDTE